jgi:hypothetical protein
MTPLACTTDAIGLDQMIQQATGALQRVHSNGGQP